MVPLAFFATLRFFLAAAFFAGCFLADLVFLGLSCARGLHGEAVSAVSRLTSAAPFVVLPATGFSTATSSGFSDPFLRAFCTSGCFSATGRGFSGAGSATDGFDTFAGSFAGAGTGFASGFGAGTGSATGFAAGAGSAFGDGFGSAAGGATGAGSTLGTGLISAAGLFAVTGAKGGIGLDAAGVAAGVSAIPASASLTCRDTVSRSASVVCQPRSGSSIGVGSSSATSSAAACSGSCGPSIAGCSKVIFATRGAHGAGWKSYGDHGRQAFRFRLGLRLHRNGCRRDNRLPSRQAVPQGCNAGLAR